MRPRAISGIPAGLDEHSSPGERFEKFVRMIVSVPKVEVDEEVRKFEKRKSAKEAKDEGHKSKT
jgi:hypothetical protein